MHSRFAFRILEKLAIGKLDEEDTTAYMGAPAEKTEQTDFKIEESTEIAKGAYRVAFSSKAIKADFEEALCKAQAAKGSTGDRHDDTAEWLDTAKHDLNRFGAEQKANPGY